MAKGWTEERRKAQAERCRKNKPWEKSTGPRTAEGKARSSMNAFKDGHSQHLRELMSDMARANREFIRAAILLHHIEPGSGPINFVNSALENF